MNFKSPLKYLSFRMFKFPMLTLQKLQLSHSSQKRLIFQNKQHFSDIYTTFYSYFKFEMNKKESQQKKKIKIKEFLSYETNSGDVDTKQ